MVRRRRVAAKEKKKWRKENENGEPQRNATKAATPTGFDKFRTLSLSLSRAFIDSLASLILVPHIETSQMYEHMKIDHENKCYNVSH